MATRVPPKPKSVTMLFAPKVQQHQARAFSMVQKQPSTRQLRPLLAVPIGGTILMTSPRRLRACGLRNKELRRQTILILIPLLRASRASHCTTAPVRIPRPRPPLRARLHAIAERRQRPSSVKRVVFIPVEAWQTNTSWLTMRSTLSSLMKGRGSSKGWSRSRRRTKAMVRMKTRGRSKI
jgi:hypothetical protein